MILRQITPKVKALFTTILMLGAFQFLGAAEAESYYDVSIIPGSSASELNFTWITDSSSTSEIQIAKAPAGTAFPEAKAKSFKAQESKISFTEFNGQDKSSLSGSYSHKVTVTGLTPKTTYLYRIGSGKKWGQVLSFTTRDTKSFGFIAVGDPQLGSKATGPKTLDNDTAGWINTLNKATEKYSDPSFILSLGDQVNDYNKRTTQDAEYKAFLSPVQLTSIPVAVANGNHDFQMGEYYGFHYNFPNLSKTEGVSYGNDGDYWFTYGSALFLVLNTNTQSIATHDLFIQKAIQQNPNAKWKIVAMHHSLYSEADHFKDPDVIDRRTNYPPIFERYHIDIVLQGHDHSYTRTFQMEKGKALKEQTADANGAVVNPTGIVYITLNSGSGSKFYDWTDATPEVFSAIRWQGKVPSFSYVSLTDNQFSITTYKTDDMSVIDTYSIIKK